MELKIPFKLRVKYLNLNEDHFKGKALFHEKEYNIDIHAQVNKRKIKVPFPVMGVTDDEILVRISGPSGVYVQDHVQFDGQSEWIEIESDAVFYEISNNQGKFDTIEIFVR
tara:strand:- start:1397 stop:1729 length:333 start_codon:yes stop_codon:yes gene_type:complete